MKAIMIIIIKIIMIIITIILVSKRPKTYNLRKLGNMRKVSKFHKMKGYCPVFLPKQKFC